MFSDLSDPRLLMHSLLSEQLETGVKGDCSTGIDYFWYIFIINFEILSSDSFVLKNTSLSHF